MENPDYRANLEQILQFTNGVNLLTVGQAMQFTGIKHYRTIHKFFPFTNGYISAATMARCMCGGSK